MNDFRTIEGATALFQAHNAIDQQNCIFVATKDTNAGVTPFAVTTGALGGLGAGMVVGAQTAGAFDGDYKGILINATERGLHMIALQGKGGMMMRVNADNLEVVPNSYMFLDYSQIKSVEIKNFTFVRKDVQKVRIAFGEDYKLYLLADIRDKNIPYQEQNFAVFMARYKK